MDMSGQHRIAAPREQVWAALNDPEILARAVPGCESMEKTSDTDFVAKVTIQIGPVKAKFAGKVKLSDLDPPKSYRIEGEGQGGVAGFGKGGAEVQLEEDGEATILKYTAKATVGGKLAQLGARLIDATAAKLAGEFFQRFAEVVAPTPVPAAAGAEAVTPPSEPVPARAALPPMVWVPLLLFLVALLLWYFGGR